MNRGSIRAVKSFAPGRTLRDCVRGSHKTRRVRPRLVLPHLSGVSSRICDAEIKALPASGAVRPPASASAAPRLGHKFPTSRAT